MVVYGKSCCIRSKVVILGQKWMYWGKVVVVWQGGCIRQIGFNRAKNVIFGQKWLYSRKSCCVWSNVAVFEHCGCIFAKVVVFGQ